jgi:drug/metabolite transporter (DMT)-like permease
LFILAAALLWSTNGFFAKSPVFHNWPADERGMLLAFWRALFAGLLVLPLVRRPRWNVWLVPMALAFAGMNVCFLQAMTHGTAANAIWLQSMAPVWVFVISWMMGLEGMHRRDVVPLVCGALGVGLILGFEMWRSAADGVSVVGVWYGLAAGVFYAAVVLLMRKLRQENGAWLVVVNHLATATLLLPYVIYASRWPSPMQLGVLTAFGLFQMGLPYLLFFQGLRRVASQEASAIALLEPVLVPIWVFVAWGERPAWWTLAGGALILTGLVYRYCRRERTEPQPPPLD